MSRSQRDCPNAFPAERRKEEEEARREEERIRKEEEKAQREKEREEERLRKQKEQEERERKKKYAPLERGISSAMNAIGREAGKQIARGLFGNRRR